MPEATGWPPGLQLLSSFKVSPSLIDMLQIPGSCCPILSKPRQVPQDRGGRQRLSYSGSSAVELGHLELWPLEVSVALCRVLNFGFSPAHLPLSLGYLLSRPRLLHLGISWYLSSAFTNSCYLCVAQSQQERSPQAAVCRLSLERTIPGLILTLQPV